MEREQGFAIQSAILRGRSRSFKKIPEMIKVICCSLFLLAFALAFIVFLEYAQYVANKYEGNEEDKTQ